MNEDIPENTWTDARVATLREMWLAGNSAGAIVQAIGPGITRNAVLGKISRMGLLRHSERPQRPSQVDNPARRIARMCGETPHKPRGARKRKAPVFVPEDAGTVSDRVRSALAEFDTPPPGAVYTGDLRNEHCRFPFRTPNGYFHCAVPEADFSIGKMYCAAHALRVRGVPRVPAPTASNKRRAA